MYDDSKNYCLLFNGKIFNYQQFKNELTSKGHKFHTTGDTEVLLHLLIEQNEKCLQKLNGFFSFAFVNLKNQNILIARDQFGIKPLFYGLQDEQFSFSSELRPLHSLNNQLNVDFDSLYYDIRFSYIPHPFSLFQEIKNLALGHFAVWSASKFELTRYFQFPNKNMINITYQEAQQNLRKHVERSIELRMISDVPLGVFLSGGIDSTVVAGIASRYKKDLKTFSIGFGHNSYDDESEYAKIAAKKFKTDHQCILVQKAEIIESIYEILESIDEPFSDTSAIPTYILCKKIKSEIKVALSGDGAEEIFSGYNKHQAENLIRYSFFKKSGITALGKLTGHLSAGRDNHFDDLIRKINKFYQLSKLSPEERFLYSCQLTDSHNALSLLMANLSENELVRKLQSKVELKKMANNNFNDWLCNDGQMVLPGDMLTKIDMMSMANSVEVRPIFLDPELVAFVFSLPQEFKINKKQRKLILSETFANIIPKQHLKRPKKGFSISLIKIFPKKLRPLIENLLNENEIKKDAIFIWDKINILKEKLFSTYQGDFQQTVWSIIVFQHWKRKYL